MLFRKARIEWITAIIWCEMCWMPWSVEPIPHESAKEEKHKKAPCPSQCGNKLFTSRLMDSNRFSVSWLEKIVSVSGQQDNTQKAGEGGEKVEKLIICQDWENREKRYLDSVSNRVTAFSQLCHFPYKKQTFFSSTPQQVNRPEITSPPMSKWDSTVILNMKNLFKSLCKLTHIIAITVNLFFSHGEINTNWRDCKPRTWLTPSKIEEIFPAVSDKKITPFLTRFHPKARRCSTTDSV